jgi:dsDNA-specific endonuclease/ATPase MutS2
MTRFDSAGGAGADPPPAPFFLAPLATHARNDMDEPDPVELPITDVLDLHTVHPRDVNWLVPHYLSECRARGILSVRIIHGKGTMALQRTVHSILKTLPYVSDFRLAGDGAGGWGATLVELSIS